MRSTSRLAGAVAVAICLTTASVASAGDPAADRQAAVAALEEGDAATAKGDHAAALKAYEKAHGLMLLPSTGLAVVKARVALGQLVEARDMAITVSRMPKAAGEKPAHAEARKEAGKIADDLASRIPSIAVQISAPANAKPVVMIDGATIPEAAATLPRKVNPGKRKVIVAASGFKTVEVDVDVAEKEAKQVPVKLEPGQSEPVKPEKPPTGEPPPTVAPPVEPPPGDDTQTSSVPPILMGVGFSVAGAGVITGVVAGVLSLTKVNSAKEDAGCSETCPSSSQAALEAELEGARTTAWVSNIGFAVAGAGAIVGVVGVVLMVTAPSSQPGSVGVYVRPAADGIVIGGTF